MDSSISSPVFVPVLGLKTEILRRRRRFNNKIPYTTFAKAFAKVLGLDFDSSKFAPDDSIATYISDPLDWTAMLDDLEVTLNLVLIDTNTWNALGGDPGIYQREINPHLTLFRVYLFISECEKRDPGSNRQIESKLKKPFYQFEPGTTISEKIRFHIAKYIPGFSDNWELLPDCYVLSLDIFKQNQLYFDLVDLAKEYHFVFTESDEDSIDEIFKKKTPLVSDLIEVVQKCTGHDII